MQQFVAVPFIFKQHISWGDMDAFNHVNNVQYYRYIENARIGYFERLNQIQTEFYTVVSSSSCRYLRPVTYPDILAIGVNVEEIRSSAFRMTYQLYSEKQQTLVAQGEVVVVCMDAKTQQKTTIPEYFKQAIIELEKTVNHQVILVNNKS
ncbi:acyl-CoA thioesterase [Acinetobacter qingfengensis]|uniref:Thioesterase n=1 Tax=Acinetobacter qingfengensis TaxID=1262585 RepID=A0A1E7RD63_9GAMM|nr:thioesterase [Acinetobacter qingfengensis]